LLVAGGVLGLLGALVLGVYVWAWSSTDGSTIARALIWRESDVGDQHRFPARRIPAGARTSPLRARVEADLVVAGEGEGADEFLRETDTLAFLVVHEDRLVRERYFDGATRESVQTSFSAAKSFELLQRLACREPGGADAGLAAVRLAAGLFRREQRLGEALIAPLLGAGALGELGQRPRRRGRLHRAEQMRELRGRAHAISPS
jgi:hypothetical protein